MMQFDKNRPQQNEVSLVLYFKSATKDFKIWRLGMYDKATCLQAVKKKDEWTWFLLRQSIF